MQFALPFLTDDIANWQRQLRPTIAGLAPPPRRTPIAQLIKSMISARTKDAISQDVFDRLKETFGSASGIAQATTDAVERVIAEVTFAEVKAVDLVEAMRQLRTSRHGYALDWLGAVPLGEALAWLERLRGVGRKVSASTLNARAFSARSESMRDSHGRADLIHGAGWMEAGMDGQAVVDGSAVAGADRG